MKNFSCIFFLLWSFSHSNDDDDDEKNGTFTLRNNDVKYFPVVSLVVYFPLANTNGSSNETFAIVVNSVGKSSRVSFHIIPSAQNPSQILLIIVCVPKAMNKLLLN